MSVTVPVVVCPETTLTGLNDSVVTTGGFTVRPPPRAVPLGNVAVIVTLALAATASVVTLKVPLLAPPAMLKLAGTVAALVLLLIKVTVRPTGGAGPLKTNVPTEPTPPVTGLGLNVSDVITAGLTVSVPVTLLAPSVAVTVTTVALATPTVVAVNVCDVFPAAIITVAGTVTEGSPLLKETVIPPVGATSLIVAVPVELVPPVTATGLKLSEVTVAGGAAVSTTPPALAALYVRDQLEPVGAGGRIVLMNAVVGGVSEPGATISYISPAAGVNPPKIETFRSPPNVAVPLTTSCE